MSGKTDDQWLDEWVAKWPFTARLTGMYLATLEKEGAVLVLNRKRVTMLLSELMDSVCGITDPRYRDSFAVDRIERLSDAIARRMKEATR